MADKEALSVLTQGNSEDWNSWVHRKRNETPGKKYRPDLRRADLHRADLSHRFLSEIDFRGANLAETVLVGADLTLSRLQCADLSKAVLAYANLTQADCREANLTDAILSYASFRWTKLQDARMSKANLSAATLLGCDMDRADLSGAITSFTTWAAVDLRDVVNLAAVEHQGPSSVGVDTVLASGGLIPEVFLRGSGMPDSVIAYVASLAQASQPIQMYSCFISHSSKDRDFCERLHNDLQGAGVRCWFAPEDLKIGDKFRDEIETAIRVHDKLLLVLSEHSVQSEWVATEVEGAFEREQRHRDRLVLFPVRLDDAVMDTSQGWAGDIRRRRHIGDFTRWKDHDSYTKAFDRLLRDLRAEPPS